MTTIHIHEPKAPDPPLLRSARWWPARWTC